MKRGKKYLEGAKLIDRATMYDAADALALAICHSNSKMLLNLTANKQL